MVVFVVYIVSLPVGFLFYKRLLSYEPNWILCCNLYVLFVWSGPRAVHGTVCQCVRIDRFVCVCVCVTVCIDLFMYSPARFEYYESFKSFSPHYKSRMNICGAFAKLRRAAIICLDKTSQWRFNDATYGEKAENHSLNTSLPVWKTATCFGDIQPSSGWTRNRQ